MRHDTGKERKGHTVTPICDQFQDISAANIEMVTKDERESLAKDAICSVLHCPLAVVAGLTGKRVAGCWWLQLQGIGQQTTLFVHLYQTIHNW